MEQGSQTPVFQEKCRGGGFILPVKEVEIHESLPEIGIHLVDRQTQGEDIDRVGIMIPVFHQQGGSV